MDIILATQNKGKVQEISQFLGDLPVSLKTLADVGISEQDPELGDTLEANARAKGLAALKRTGMWTLADDTGVQFAGLNGAPGVHTKEWVNDCDDPGEFEQFLRQQFAGIADLTGVFRTVAALTWPATTGNVSHIFIGKVPGRLTLEGRGERVPHLPFCRHFIPDGTEKTLSEMNAVELAEHSHRGRAFRQVAEFLREKLTEYEVLCGPGTR